jgi:hypothetical protein
MIYVAVNLPSRKLTYKQLDDIVNHATDVLGIPEDITLEIEFTYDVEFPQYGDADVERDGDVVGLIRINRRASTNDIIATLFHELVHVNQIIAGRLTLGEGNRKSTWHGREHGDNYNELPWEKEAFELEQYMMKTYKEKYDGLHASNW